MLVIRPEQKDALRAHALAQFEGELARHARGFAPRHAAALGDGPLKACVDAACLRARRHGFTLRGPVRLWLDLTFMFGIGFATDPQLRTVSRVLDPVSDAGPRDQLKRARALRERAVHFAQQVAGVDGDRERAAVMRFRALSLNDLAVRSDDDIVALLASLYPEKVAVTGTRALDEISARARTEARALALDGPAAVPGVTLLMFAFGHDCLADPLFPWIARSLRPARLHPDEPRDEGRDGGDATARLERARRMALRFISEAPTE